MAMLNNQRASKNWQSLKNFWMFFFKKNPKCFIFCSCCHATSWWMWGSSSCFSCWLILVGKVWGETPTSELGSSSSRWPTETRIIVWNSPSTMLGFVWNLVEVNHVRMRWEWVLLMVLLMVYYGYILYINGYSMVIWVVIQRFFHGGFNRHWW